MLTVRVMTSAFRGPGVTSEMPSMTSEFYNRQTLAFYQNLVWIKLCTRAIHTNGPVLSLECYHKDLLQKRILWIKVIQKAAIHTVGTFKKLHENLQKYLGNLKKSLQPSPLQPALNLVKFTSPLTLANFFRKYYKKRFC